MKISEKEIEEFLKGFATKDGQSIEIPIAGSLGLLAFGDLGYLAWKLRKRRQALPSDKQVEDETKD